MRVSVLGLGKAGQRHERAVQMRGDTVLAAVADGSPEVRARYQSLSCPVVASLDELLRIETDAVVVALPHAYLADAAARVIERGLHVLVEKPMATTLPDARRLVSLAERAGVRLMVSYNHRFRDEYRTAKRWISEGRIGEPRFICEQMFAAKGPLPPWVWDPAVSGGGMMTYNGAHMIDHVLWLMDGAIAQVSAMAGSLHFGAPVEDSTAVTLRFENGALGSLVQSKANVEHLETRWETRIVGSEGALHVVSGSGVSVSGAGFQESAESGPDRRFEEALGELVAAVADRRAPSPGGADALNVLACLRAIYDDWTPSGR